MMAKIVSEGHGPGTYVETEDGKRLEGVTEINWHIEAGDIGRAEVTLGVMGVEVLGVLTCFAQHPVEGDMRPIKRIEFADGTVWEGPDA